MKFLENNIISFNDEKEIKTIYSEDESEFIDAIDQLNKKGGNVYIDTPIINLNTQSSISINGQLPGGIIGKRQTNGEYPRINFIIRNYKDIFPGFNIFGSNKFIEYIIIEHSPFYGISIYGNNNSLDHVISRYNYGSGFNIIGDFNTLNYCYSYRNFAANIYLVNADSFNILGEVNNIFNYCFAWDNANSGFNYISYLNSSELNYLHSGSWNNGNVDIFIGKYDYYNGRPLDKNLWTIQEIMESDPKFASNYYNKKYNIDDAELGGFSVNEWISEVESKIRWKWIYIWKCR